MRKNRVALALTNAFPFASPPAFPLAFPLTAFFAQAPAIPIVLATAFALPLAAQTVADAPVKTLVASVGFNNLTDQEYWNFHPYPRRTWADKIKDNF